MSPMNSWKSMGPVVVSALKLGAVEPRRRLYERGTFKSVGIQSILIIYIIQCLLYHITYGAGRCSVEAILTALLFFFSLLLLLFRFLRDVLSVGGGSGAKKEDSVHKKGLCTYASYKYIIYLFSPPCPPPFGDLITPFRLRISSQARPERIGHFLNSKCSGSSRLVSY